MKAGGSAASHVRGSTPPENEPVPMAGEMKLRSAVEQKAKSLGCLEAIAGLSSSEAVCFVQRLEGYTPCFGASSPLLPWPENATCPPGTKRENLCGVTDCYWKEPCDRYRTAAAMSFQKSTEKNFMREIEESIFRLQKLDLEPGIRQVVEEAAHLLAAGRHIEAGALIEKADALVAQGQGAAAVEAGSETAAGQEDSVAAIIDSLAQSLANLLVSAFRELERRLGQQSAAWGRTLRQELDSLQSRVTDLSELLPEIREAALDEQKAFKALPQNNIYHLNVHD
jgi:hypothetical protein